MCLSPAQNIDSPVKRKVHDSMLMSKMTLNVEAALAVGSHIELYVCDFNCCLNKMRAGWIKN